MKRLLLCSVVAILAACAVDPYTVAEPANYDALIGKRFSEVIYRGREVYRLVRETPTIEELESRRSDGCILVFGVMKANDIIQYWRVDSGPGTCAVRKKPLNL